MPTTKFDSTKISTFTYKKTDLHTKSVSWAENNNPEKLSKFDQDLRKLWQEKVDNCEKAFSYKFSRDKCKWKPLESINGMDGPIIAQLNNLRGLKKRTRPDFEDIKEEFDPKMFNFTKIDAQEIFYKFEFEESDDILRTAADNSSHYIITNAAPIENCHILIVPELELGRNQVISAKDIRISLDLLLLSNQPSFRVMGNSIWGWASINHFHLHAFYMDHQNAGDVMSVQEKKPIFVSVDKNVTVCRTIDEKVFIPAYVWDFHKSAVNESANQACHQINKLCHYLLNRTIPYNIMIQYHGITNKPRVIIWARKSARGFQPDPRFDAAVAELGGHCPYKVDQRYDEASFEDALKHLRANLLEKEVYDEIEGWLKENLAENSN